MKKILFTLILLGQCLYSEAQVKFQQIIGGPDEADAYSVQQTSDGGYIITGDCINGSGDIYLIKTDANGNLVWTKTFEGGGGENSYFVQQTTDGGYIIIGDSYNIMTNIDICLIKTDANGDTLWTKTFSGPVEDHGYCVRQTTDGGYIITGTLGCDLCYPDVCLIKTDANGDSLWTKTFGDTQFDDGFCVQQTTDGGYIITGRTDNSLTGSPDVYLVKTDANGDSLWTKTFGGPNWDDGQSIQQTTDGGYIIVGTTYSFGAGDADVYLVKTAANGNLLWSKTFGGIQDELGYSVQQTTDGGYIIVGNDGPAGSDVYLIKTNSNGNLLWSKTFGGTGYDYGRSVQQTTDGGYIIAGTKENGGGWDRVYLIKTDSLPGGCNEGSAATLVSTPATIVGNSATIVGSANTAVISSPTFVIGSVDTSIAICTCSSHFYLYADTVPHHWILVNQASGATPISYLWNWGDGFTSTGAMPSHTYNIPGYYNICLTITDAVGCTSMYCDSSTYIFRGNSNNTVITINVVLPTNITELNTNENEVMVYPNPANDVITITSSINFVATEIILFDASGRAVMEKKLNKSASISVKHLNAGIYFYKIKDAKGNEVRGKVVKE